VINGTYVPNGKVTFSLKYENGLEFIYEGDMYRDDTTISGNYKVPSKNIVE
jgi:hypothetical protein